MGDPFHHYNYHPYHHYHYHHHPPIRYGGSHFPPRGLQVTPHILAAAIPETGYTGDTRNISNFHKPLALETNVDNCIIWPILKILFLGPMGFSWATHTCAKMLTALAFHYLFMFI